MAQLLEIAVNITRWVFTPLAFLLQIYVLIRFRDPLNRDYPLATIYSFFLPILTASVYAFSSPYTKLDPDGHQKFMDVYAAADLVMHILLLALMLQLTGRALRMLNMNSVVFILLVLLSILVLGGASWYFLEGGTPPEMKFAAIRRYVSVYCVILNLVWWTFLLRTRKIDRRILLLSAGIGLQMTGQVLSDSLSTIGAELKTGGRPWIIVGVLIGILTHLMCLYTWLRAFSPANASTTAARAEKQPLAAQ